jgi:nitroimidazol reductase NimA-like FMN-containing flavoprotein (pyridoxamine 5'-phosphate oxidase superfamily)
VAGRREELQLTRQQVADRAGMSVPYLEYLEHHPDMPTVAAVWRLANALQTTPAELLGGGLDLPPGSQGPSPRPALQRLGQSECLALLAPGGVGRVAVTTMTGPAVFPVNFVMAGRTIVFRTGAGAVLAAHGDGPVAFEVDRLDEALAQGWSVLAQGTAHRVTDAAELAWVKKNTAVWPWAGGDRHVYVRVIPERITGRRILAG